MHSLPDDELERVLASSTCPFSTVGEEVRERLAAAMEIHSYGAGDLLVRQGDQGRFLLILLDGTATASLRQADGSVTAIAELHPGNLVGEMSLVTNEPRTADVTCLVPLRAGLLSVDDFDVIAREYPELRAVLTEVVAERLGQATYDSLSGKDVHGYRIVRCVGRGGMGIVYEAVPPAGARRVALKMMNHRLLYQPRSVQRFQQEMDTLKTLHHPAIACVHERFTAYRTQFLVLEFCEGTTLTAIFSKYGALPEPTVRAIVGQLANALQYVHDRGVIHRDLKPSNVMVSDTGELKLLDFGIATMASTTAPDATGATSASLELMGTPQYMAPEQLGGHIVDVRADWYGLGCIAYEALTGRRVVQSADLFAIIEERSHFAVPPAPELGSGASADMHAFLAGALALNRDQRHIDLRAIGTWAAPIRLGS